MCWSLKPSLIPSSPLRAWFRGSSSWCHRPVSQHSWACQYGLGGSTIVCVLLHPHLPGSGAPVAKSFLPVTCQTRPSHCLPLASSTLFLRWPRKFRGPCSPIWPQSLALGHLRAAGGGAGLSRAILQAMLHPSGAAQSCSSRPTGARKPGSLLGAGNDPVRHQAMALLIRMNLTFI